jgi:hypothetical protein
VLTGIFIGRRPVAAQVGSDWSWAEDAVGGARDAGGAAVEDVGVDHRGIQVVVTEQLLNGADVAAIFQQMGGEGVAERVGGGPLGETRPADSLEHGALHHGLVEVMAAALAPGAVDVASQGRSWCRT